MHFVLLTAFAIPVLLIVTVEAMFGGKEQPRLAMPSEVSHIGARAA